LADQKKLRGSSKENSNQGNQLPQGFFLLNTPEILVGSDEKNPKGHGQGCRGSFFQRVAAEFSGK
jgi:hypothetical protein